MKKIMLAIALIILVSVFCYAESCKGSGLEKEYKSDEGNCTYQTRTCCENGEWSDWGEECKVCGEGECWNGSMCEKSQTSLLCTSYENNWGVVGGSLTREATCTSNGWSYGEWEGYCQCEEGLSWYKNKCVTYVYVTHIEPYTVPSVGSYNDLAACNDARSKSVNNHNSEGYIRTDLSYQCTGLNDYGFILTPCQQYGGKYAFIFAAYDCGYQ